MRTRISIGLTGRTAPSTVAQVAKRVEEAGLRGLWLNDVPHGDSIAGLASAAAATRTLHLGTGVIPLDRRPASDILRALSEHPLPAERLTLGVGSGGPVTALARVEDGVSELRAGTKAAVIVGALGPRMRALGARVADGLLLSWLTPSAAAETVGELRLASAKSSVRAVLYTRAIVSSEARAALEKESADYESYPQYAAHFARSGFSARDATIDGSEPQQLADAASGYLESVDELVLRAITPTGVLDELLRFVDAVSDAV